MAEDRQKINEIGWGWRSGSNPPPPTPKTGRKQGFAPALPRSWYAYAGQASERVQLDSHTRGFHGNGVHVVTLRDGRAFHYLQHL